MTNKQLVEIIKKVVQAEVKKEMKSYRKKLVKELGEVMAEQMRPQPVQQRQQIIEEEDDYQTDDPILKKVLQGRNTQNFSKGAVEEGSRQSRQPQGAPSDIRSKFQQLQEGVQHQPQNPQSMALSFDEDASFNPHGEMHPYGQVPPHLQNLTRKNYSDLVKRFGS